MPTGASLELANPAAASLERGVWLSPVEITDPEAKNPAVVQRPLTLSISQYWVF